jgi:A nuclease family of the HNH/ENDO VII superfamily with conserved AHH
MREPITQYKEPTFLEKIIAESTSKKDSETFNRIERRYTAANKAKIDAKLAQYRTDSSSKDAFHLAAEEHSSKRLGDFMRAIGLVRPGANWEAHHLISGSYKEAMGARAILADEEIKMGIDDPDNGCWMPKTKKDARPTIYPNAIPHSRIHREKYYNWIFNLLFNAESALQAGAILKTVRMQLLQGNINLKTAVPPTHPLNWHRF